jgi:hypothetical protein
MCVCLVGAEGWQSVTVIAVVHVSCEYMTMCLLQEVNSSCDGLHIAASWLEEFEENEQPAKGTGCTSSKRDRTQLLPQYNPSEGTKMRRDASLGARRAGGAAGSQPQLGYKARSNSASNMHASAALLPLAAGQSLRAVADRSSASREGSKEDFVAIANVCCMAQIQQT